MPGKRRKAVNFDLSTEALAHEFGESNYRRGYKLIQDFFEQHGFEHRQWSGYVSREVMGNDQILDTIIDLFVANEWIAYCANRFDVTDVGEEHDMLSRVPELLKVIKQAQDAGLTAEIYEHSADIDDNVFDASADDELEI
jgi:virulence-associated protein VapD